MLLTVKKYSLPLLLLLVLAQANAQVKQALPRSRAESQGMQTQGILDFLDAAAKSKNELHSIMILRHGHVVAEGWWSPYQPKLKHTLYSASKSFTATAIGLAVGEKRLTLSDKVIRFFPDQLPDTVSEYLAALEVKHLLTMSVGQAPDPSGTINQQDSNWIRAFLATPLLYPPGSRFLYNSMATYMLSAIIQKITGQTVLDYLSPRLFKPLGIEAADWEKDPQGINTGGWGLRLQTEDLARFGQLFLQKGRWKGKQILPAGWVEAASTRKIDQNPDASEAARNASDWLQGYCYQMWRSRNNSYRGDGAFGQYILVLPDQDAVIAITSETPDMQDELNLVWKYLLPAMKSGTLPANPEAEKRLSARLQTLRIPPPAPMADSVVAETAFQKTYLLQANERHWKSMGFEFPGNLCRLALQTDSALHYLYFGHGEWVKGTTTKKGPSLVIRAKGHFAGLPATEIRGSYRWIGPKTVELTLRYVESPHTEVLTCHFEGNQVAISIQNSFEKNRQYPVIIGNTP